MIRDFFLGCIKIHILHHAGKYPQLMNSPGCETGPGPQLATWGKSTVCTVDAFGYQWHWTTSSSEHIPFDWAGP